MHLEKKRCFYCGNDMNIAARYTKGTLKIFTLLSSFLGLFVIKKMT